MTTYPFETKDFLGRSLCLQTPPQRIVSLVPSQTELLFDLGLATNIVGVTSFCVHPKAARKEKVVVGGTKNPKIERIRELKPDLVLGNKEENQLEHIEKIADFAPVWLSDIVTPNDNERLIRQVGELTNRRREALTLITEMQAAFTSLPAPQEPLPTALYLIWRKPYMAAGSDTFISHMLPYAGFRNVLSQTRYPECSPEEMKRLQPDVVLLSSEPYPFKERHISEIRQWLPEADIQLVDGEFFSWYGSRMRKAPAYFKAFFKKKT